MCVYLLLKFFKIYQNWLQFSRQNQVTDPWGPRASLSVRKGPKNAKGPRFLAAPEHKIVTHDVPIPQAKAAYRPDQIPPLRHHLPVIVQAVGAWGSIWVLPVGAQIKVHAVKSRGIQERRPESRHTLAYLME